MQICWNDGARRWVEETISVISILTTVTEQHSIFYSLLFLEYGVFFSSHILSSTCSSFSCDNRRKKKEKTRRRTLFACPFFECLRIPGLLKITPASNEETIYIYVFGVTYKRNTYQNVIASSFACITLTHRSSHSIHQQLSLIPGPLRPIMLVPLIPLGQF